MILIAGPCAIEYPGAWLADFACSLKEVVQDYPCITELVVKSSFCKANRTKKHGFRGIDQDMALGALWYASEMTGCRTLTDIHETEQAKWIGTWVDVIQIPAFLGRQSYLLEAAAESGCQVALKRPQWERGPDWAKYASEKVGHTSPNQSADGAPWLIHRGDTNGTVDFIEVADMCEVAPTFIDLTHPNRQNKRNSRILAVGAALPISGIFAECHPYPPQAFCDGPNQLTLDELRKVLDVVASLRT